MPWNMVFLGVSLEMRSSDHDGMERKGSFAASSSSIFPVKNGPWRNRFRPSTAYLTYFSSNPVNGLGGGR